MPWRDEEKFRVYDHDTDRHRITVNGGQADQNDGDAIEMKRISYGDPPKGAIRVKTEIFLSSSKRLEYNDRLYWHRCIAIAETAFLSYCIPWWGVWLCQGLRMVIFNAWFCIPTALIDWLKRNHYGSTWCTVIFDSRRDSIFEGQTPSTIKTSNPNEIPHVRAIYHQHHDDIIMPSVSMAVCIMGPRIVRRMILDWRRREGRLQYVKQLVRPNTRPGMWLLTKYQVSTRQLHQIGKTFDKASPPKPRILKALAGRIAHPSSQFSSISPLSLWHST